MPIKVLLVDDERSLLDQAKSFVDKLNEDIVIRTAVSADTALDMVDEADIDVMVSDYQMPGKDGLELLKEIRDRRDLDIPFIVFTGKGREEVAMKALNLGADRYVRKGGDAKTQYKVLVDAILQEHEHHRSKKNLERSKKELKKSKKKYEKRFNKAPLGIFHYDEDGIIKKCNDEFVEIIGSSREDLIGFDMLNGLKNESLKEEVGSSLKRGKGLYEGEYTSVTGDKTTFVKVFLKGIKDEQGEINSGIGLVEDITEKKKMENELKEREEKYRALIESAFAGIGITDFDETLKFVNSKFAEMLGYEKEELVGKNLKDLAPEEVQIRFEEETEKRKEGKTGRYGSKLKKKNGDIIEVMVYASPFKDAEGEFVGTMGIVTDITDRKKYERELKRKETYLDHIPAFITVLDEDGDIKYHSYPADEINGLDSSKIIGTDSLQYVHPDDRENIHDIFSQVLEDPGEEYSTELRAESEDGWIWLEIDAINFLHDPEIDGIIITAQDISDRKKIEEELKKSEKRFRTIIEKSADAVFLLDREGDYTYANQAASELLGYTQEELTDLSIGDLSREKDLEDHLEKFERVLDEEKISSEIRLVKKDGSTITVALDSVLLPNGLLYGSCRDISERKELEKRIQENKEKLEKLNEISAEFQTYESEEDLFSFAIEAAEEILDFDICAINAPEGEYMKAVEMSSNFPEDASSIESPLPIDDSLAGRTYLEKRPFLIEHKEENEDINPTKDDFESGISVPIGKFGVFQAVSSEPSHFDEEDLKMAELLARNVSEALKRVRAKEREDFLHSLLRHDLGNMIQVIQGYLQLLGEEEKDEALYDMITEAEKATKNAQNLIGKVRTLRDIMVEDEMEAVNVCKITESVVSKFKSRAEKKDIELRWEGEEMEVMGGRLLKEMFSNIIENAIKHAECDEIVVSCKDKGRYGVINFEDDGRGIPDEEKEQIFERGYKKGDDAGSGLGLYIVNEIAKSYGGSVEVKDSELGGTDFQIELNSARVQR